MTAPIKPLRLGLLVDTYPMTEHASYVCPRCSKGGRIEDARGVEKDDCIEVVCAECAKEAK